MLRMKTKLTLAVLMAFLWTGSLPLGAAPAVTRCASGFSGSGLVINELPPHDAFFTSGPVVKHVSRVQPGAGPCDFGSAEDIPLGPGITTASGGIALDDHGSLYVAAGRGRANLILKIEFPYTGQPTLFFRGAEGLRGLAIRRNILYAADFVGGKVLRFDLETGPSSVITFATLAGPMGIFVADQDDLFVTSNPRGTVEHVLRRPLDAPAEVSTIAAGLSLPEGISGDNNNFYIAAGTQVFRVPRTGGTPTPYAGTPIRFSHAVFMFADGGYVTDSNPPNGNVFKIQAAR